MGVQGLWTLVSPAARPVKLESLRDRKLAIDASIWIHQFMRTMRSEDGTVLRNGHTLGFFRRICKLLFYNIKPVFVFDGGAPTLKRATIRERRQRRQGMKENAKRTAEKILKAQMKAQLLHEEEKRRELVSIGEVSNNTQLDNDDEENYVYLEELDNTAALDTLRHQNAIKQDQYQLPPLIHDNNQPRRKIDPRFASDQELLDFIDEFKPSDIDMESSVFQALPPEIQYEIIQDLKLKSRQTSWSRLDNMVRQSKTALDFSKQQIMQLKHRNEMTQRVMQMNDMASNQSHDSVAAAAPSRIASERGKEYLLVKNENMDEGLGWRLPGVAKTKPASISAQQQTAIEDAIVIDDHKPTKMDDDSFHSTMDTTDFDDDPVARAVANNPSLALLMGDFEDDDLEATDSELGNTDILREGHNNENGDHSNIDDFDGFDDDAPLFISTQRREYQQTHDETDYGQGENNDDAVDQILLKMYHTDRGDDVIETTPGSLQQHSLTSDDSLALATETSKDMEVELDADNFYQLWLSRVPDSFIYMYSINDSYKYILKNAIADETTISDLEEQLKNVQKVSGKSNSNNLMNQSAYGFHQEFLKSARAWKQRLIYEQSALTMYQQQRQHDNQPSGVLANAATGDASIADKDETWLLSDDGYVSEEDEIRLVDLGRHQIPSAATQQHTNQAPMTSSMSDEPVTGTKLEPQLLSSTLLGPSGFTASQEDDGSRIGDGSDDGAETEPDLIDVKEPLVPEMPDSHKVEQEEINELADGLMDIGYNSDEELAAGDVVEEENDEFARFVSDIASRDIGSVRQELQDDVQHLNKQQTKQMGNSDTVSDQMVQDIQELLQLFGIPYVVSPMEAEAQCAYLLEHNLVDGVVTDDSDVFLFGGKRVYKNMFSQQKYVECYLLHDIVREMHLDRKKLIQLAYFLGSDYTPGVPGIGYVSAMEILAAFHANSDNDDDNDGESLEYPLKRFKEWYEDGLDKTEFEKKFRKQHKHLDIPADFPNPLIKEAYYSPLVDSSLETFTWSPPQLDSLRLYLMKSFSWSEEKTDEILIPVIREMNQRQATGIQTSISSFFDPTAGLQDSYRSAGMKRKHKSKRIQQVVKQLGKKKQKPMIDNTGDDSSDSESVND
ncbi:hypothetical protein BCR42DRAFT_487904 [Absidia repens]|uniref:PIN domain-like protein n=1 Tax=Absidia repens TaxID=90262 RepID=A0A1X2IVU5_9FUNG|nr:hypothetical protein BCR42DRAFT_487904 [Absidia repens]